MRRLTIAFAGVSKALAAVRLELERYGHVAGDEAVDLLIEDGSQPLPAHSCEATRISLRLGIGPVSDCGLPPLQLRGYDRAQQLLGALDLAEEPSGNGQRLHQHATIALTDWVALQVSGFSRDPDYFRADATANDWPEEGLQALEALAFVHRFNRTTDQALLHQSEVPIIEKLQTSLQTFASRAALNIAGREVTYRQLQARALAIQRQLRPLLKTTETSPVVGVCLEKSVDLYASILAVLGCGAVYLPLAPDHPAGRQRIMLENAGARVLLHGGAHSLCSEFTSLDVSATGPFNAMATQSLILERPTAAMPCMVLYTSGTTGEPKGVLLSQRNLAHFCAWFRRCMAVNENSRVLQFSPLGFDSSLIDIFPSLIAGATLIVPSENQRRDPQQLLDLIRQQHITHAFLPPALLSILPLDQPLGLSHVFTGGDACEPYVIDGLATQCQLHNLYGPTETTVLVTHRILRPSDSNRSLGHPIPNSQVLILDDHLQPVGENVMGELYIAGPGVGLGYVGKPQQAGSPFIELQVPGEPPLHTYRSGDLAKWTADGIELGGRRDHQVKIRGFRVEPQEIEQCLRNSRLFRQVAVVIGADHRILGFVAQPETGATIACLAEHARQRLPDYMRPQIWTELPRMPCSDSGKVDRQALLAWPVARTVNIAVATTAQTPLHTRLVDLWSELLELPSDGLCIDVSFFNLGGHSLLLSTLLLRIREHFGRSFSLSHFIEVPTIRTLTTLIENGAMPATLAGQASWDAQREWSFKALPGERAGNPRHVIVTGANSFVGVHIVQALLAMGTTKVACLVRESPGHPAAARFASALREYQLEHLDLSRVQVYAADISRPRLGLTDERYNGLAQDYGVLVHNAAHVNHVMDYASLVRDNVEPIAECLRLCETHCKKVFNFVSTLSASSSIDAQGQILEAPAVATLPVYIKNGYNLSKWVAERQLGRALDRGAWVNIYRPGNISFNTLNGVCQPHKNRLMLMLKGSLQLGLVPELDLNFDLMPVDFFARFIAFHSGEFHLAANVFNLHNPQPLSWAHYLDAFSRAGHAFERVGVARWQQALRTVNHDNALFGVLGFYLDSLGDDIGDTSKIRHDNARRGVHRMGEQYPEKDSLLLSKGCNYLKTVGFL